MACPIWPLLFFRYFFCSSGQSYHLVLSRSRDSSPCPRTMAQIVGPSPGGLPFVWTIYQSVDHCKLYFCMFILSSSNSRQQGFTNTLARWKIAAKNSYTSLSARNSKKLCSLHSQLAKDARKQTSNKHIVYSASWVANNTAPCFFLFARHLCPTSKNMDRSNFTFQSST